MSLTAPSVLRGIIALEIFCLVAKIIDVDELNEKTEQGRKLRNGMTPPEIILWKAIRGKQLGYVVNRQKPFGRYFLDFYIASLQVAIEVDGRIHEDLCERDQRRDAWLRSQGVTVIQVSGRSIFENISDIITFLDIRLHEVAGTNPPQD
jgi:very-short-patch-repair endonuclease